jgi:hypothetical protein
VNLLALLLRAQRDGIGVGQQVSAEGLSNALLKLVDSIEAAEREAAARDERPTRAAPWLIASKLEVHLSLRQHGDVVDCAKRYLALGDADAFEFGSTARQLREIWQLHQHSHPMVAAILPLLEAELLKKRGGLVQDPTLVEALVPDKRELESVYGHERFNSFVWLERGIRAGHGVARVEDVNEKAVGTGFVVLGRSLRREWGAQPVFVTNRHVMDAPPPPTGIHVKRAVAHFTSHAASRAPKKCRIGDILWRSEGNPALDVIITRLESDVDTAHCLDVDETTALEMSHPAPRIYVVGHPLGQALSYSLYDNELVGVDEPFFYYRSPTEKGSSGSPLFNNDWSVIGVHHRGTNSSWNANGGSQIRAVSSATRNP